MTLPDDLSRLDDLRQRGVLSDEEFARAKARLLDGVPGRGDAGGPAAAINGARRSRSDRWIAGVCGGLASLTGVAAWFWRLAFVLLAMCGGAGVLLYVLLWVFVPDEPALGDGRPTAAT